MKEEGQYVLSKINQIGRHNRQALYLRFIEDMSPKDIGDILGISTDAASVRINRGLQELRTLTGYNKRKDVPK